VYLQTVVLVVLVVRRNLLVARTHPSHAPGTNAASVLSHTGWPHTSNLENLEYSGISTDMENSRNYQGILCNVGENF